MVPIFFSFSNCSRGLKKKVLLLKAENLTDLWRNIGIRAQLNIKEDSNLKMT